MSGSCGAWSTCGGAWVLGWRESKSCVERRMNVRAGRYRICICGLLDRAESDSESLDDLIQGAGGGLG